MVRRRSPLYSVARNLGKAVIGYGIDRAIDKTMSYGKRKLSQISRTPSGRSPPGLYGRGSRFKTPRTSPRTVRGRSPPGSVFGKGSPIRRLRSMALQARRRQFKYGAATSKSTGFISTPFKKKRTTQTKSNTKGTTIVVEKGGVLDAGVNGPTGGNTVAVGHCNYPLSLSHQIFWRGIVKRLLVKMGGEECLNFEVNLPFLTNGDVFRVAYRPYNESLQTFRDFTVTGGTSPETVAQSFHTFFYGLAVEDGCELQHIYYLPQTSTTATRYIRQMCVVNLYNATFTIFGKSTLKVQNRTVNTAAGDEESVDNVPLHGKAYFGYGSGSSAISIDGAYAIAASGFWAEDTTGLLAKVPQEKWYQEVVPPTMFKEVRTHGKVLLDPGHIRTSVLDSKKTFSVSKIYKTLFCTKNPGNHDKTQFGLFRFIMLEKMINAVAGTAANSIKVAYESNLRIGGYINTRNNNETIQMNSVANIASTGEA